MDRLKKRDRLWYTENMNWDDMIDIVERLKDENAIKDDYKNKNSFYQLYN